MEKIQLKSTARTADAKVGSLRKAGQLPAVLYGHNVKNQNLLIDARDFDKVLRRAGESTIIELLTEDGQPHPVLIHDVQHDHVSSKVTHVDFYQINMSEKLTATVQLEFTGEPKAVRELGGTLVKVLGEVEVECLPGDLPHSLTVDTATLESFDHVLYVKDIPVPAKVKVLTDPDEVVAKVQPPRDVEAELAEPVVEDVSAVEGAQETPAAETSGEPNSPGKEAKSE